MAFEALINKPMLEEKLLELLVAETRSNYGHLPDKYYYFKLKDVDGKSSEIIWPKTFTTREEMADFFYDTKFFRAAITIKFREKGCYEVLYQGFQCFDVFEIWPDKILNSRPIKKYSKNYEKTPMLPRELIERGFGEITRGVGTSKSNIPV